MSRRITVRLPDELVEFIDRCVRGGTGSSRAAVIAAAVDRKRRRALAERDVQVLLARDGDDLDALARHATRTPLTDPD